MIGARELDLLEGGAILVNVARAAIVDQGAMLAALKDGRLGGAVLDVFEQEPLDESSPLWDMRNVILTPHSSGFRATHWDEVIELFSANLRRFVSGEPLEHVVDSTAGY
jgi:phosphoglycerate dehydrogenase-like enzyme